MKTIGIMALLTVVLAGCASEMAWVRPPGVTAEAAQQQLYECRQQAAKLPSRPPPLFLPSPSSMPQIQMRHQRRNDLFHHCMTAKGYRLEPKPP